MSKPRRRTRLLAAPTDLGLRLELAPDWLGGTVPSAELIAPTLAGTLRVEPAR